MRILAIETTALVASVAVVDEYRTIGEMTLNDKKTHSQTIMPLVKTLLDMLAMTLDDIDYIACSSGPGSFTGLRIGAATAKGLAHGACKKIIPVPTLDALAYNIFDANNIIVPLMDARRDQVYTAFFKREGDKLTKLCDDFADGLDNVLERLNQYAGAERVIFLGDGAYVHRDAIQNHNKNHLFAPQNLNMQSAAAVGSVAFLRLADQKAVAPDEFEISYLRQSQAEREYTERKER